MSGEIPLLENGNPDNMYWHSYRHVIDLNGDLCIQRVHDGAWLPKDEDNGHYRRYLAWIEKGNVPEQFDYRDPAQSKAAYERECEHFKQSKAERIQAAQDAYFAKGQS